MTNPKTKPRKQTPTPLASSVRPETPRKVADPRSGMTSSASLARAAEAESRGSKRPKSHGADRVAGFRVGNETWVFLCMKAPGIARPPGERRGIKRWETGPITLEEAALPEGRIPVAEVIDLVDLGRHQSTDR